MCCLLALQLTLWRQTTRSNIRGRHAWRSTRGGDPAHTSSRMGAGLDMLFFASDDKVLPSSATSPTGLFPCTVL